MRKALIALALLFLVTHVGCLPPTFGDIDAVNFGLGVRDFDVAAHQPHPPGYPLFIAAAKITTAALRVLGVDVPEPRGIAILGAIGGALALPALFLIFRVLVRDDEVALWAVVITAASPLYWVTAVRPLSDMAGFAVAAAAQLLLIHAVFGEGVSRRARGLIAGAFVSALAIGVRSQNFTLTLPLLALVLALPRTGFTGVTRLLALAAAALGGLVWAIPLVAASGGLDAYLTALGDQAGEDFVGAAMVWTSRNVRTLANALQYSFVWPWGGLLIGAVVLAAAVAGFVRLALRQRFGLVLLLTVFAPYAMFHLVFQETVMVRYALPLVPMLALLAAYGLGSGGRWPLRAGSAALAVVMLVIAVPASRAHAREGSPGARSVLDAVAAGSGPIAMHAVMLRHEEWYHGNASGRVIRRRHGEEILSLVDVWRQHPETTLWFLADPRRSDLAMLDPRTRHLLSEYRWAFPEMPAMGGARPNRVELYRMRPPGWMLDQGWAVTAEVAGQSARAGARPDVRPSVAWVRSRPGAATLVLGGRHLGHPESAPAEITVSAPSGVLATWHVQPGFFVHRLDLAAGMLEAADAYVPLSVTAAPAGSAPVSLEQFSLQDPGVPMLALETGWQEPEYSGWLGTAWRWMSARAGLWVRPIGRDVTLRIRAESPMKYFDSPPVLEVTAGDEPIATLTPDDDFTWDVRLPARALERAGGQVWIRSSQAFVPGRAGGDQRELALRVYDVSVR